MGMSRGPGPACSGGAHPLDASPDSWTGAGWSRDSAAATPIVDYFTTGEGINPVQVIFNRVDFRMVVKVNDWFGTHVEFLASPTPHGPWTLIADVAEPVVGDPAEYNKYFAAWVPWRQPAGNLIWSISNNRWDGQPSPLYHPPSTQHHEPHRDARTGQHHPLMCRQRTGRTAARPVLDHAV